jgi:GalNAc-alpha-(1->4)-GalNAc-alpha-(1->3)-diNAcBac-PP-undecaprenol alpha-1,4-N-acetyl-D-galactosaminyltransferase
LAAAMDRLISNPLERQRMAERAPEVLERFGVDIVMAKWDALIKQICQNAN